MKRVDNQDAEALKQAYAAEAARAVLAPVDVARYTQGDGCLGGDESMRPSITGEWVLYADYTDLAAALAAAREENAEQRRVSLEWIAEAEAKAVALRQRAEAAERDARKVFDNHPPQDCPCASQCLNYGHCYDKCSLAIQDDPRP